MYLAENIDLVQINVKSGVDEYYLPKGVNWRDRVIDKIVLVVRDYGTTSNDTYSPIDGITPLLTDVSGLYFDLYSDSGEYVAHNAYYENFMYTNNYPLTLNSKLSLNLSRLYFTETPQTDGCILLYVYYGGRETEDYDEAKKSVTVRVHLNAGEKVDLQYIVDNYIHLQPDSVKGVMVSAAANNPVYLTLREEDSDRVIDSLHSNLLLPPVYTKHEIS